MGVDSGDRGMEARLRGPGSRLRELIQKGRGGEARDLWDCGGGGLEGLEGALLLTWRGLTFRSWSVPGKDWIKEGGRFTCFYRVQSICHCELS